jgi:hypothetical protein
MQVGGVRNDPDLDPRSQNFEELELTRDGTTWTLTRNDLDFTILEAEGGKEYTVFMERMSCRLFLLTDAFKSAAQYLWTFFPFPPLPLPFSTFYD